MAELFQKDVRTINHHIQAIFDEGELDPVWTIRKFRIVQTEGTRSISRMIDFYNLDMIISVGYRVKSLIATRFRIWATQKLTEYIKGELAPVWTVRIFRIVENEGLFILYIYNPNVMAWYEHPQRTSYMILCWLRTRPQSNFLKFGNNYSIPILNPSNSMGLTIKYAL